MFSSFLRTIPQISIFHNPSSPPSLKALAMLQSAVSSPYPPGSPPTKGPLKFNLEVIEAPPTSDQITTILSYLPTSTTSSQEDEGEGPRSIAHFISSHPSAPSLPERPHSAQGLEKLAKSNPQAVKWPIVVDWTSGKASVGSVQGVQGILEYLRKRRDGEVKGEENFKPKGWFS